MNRPTFFWATALLLAWPFGAQATPVGEVTGFSQESRAVIVSCGENKVRVEVWDDDLVRVWLSNDGTYSGVNARGDRVIQPGRERFKGPSELHVADAGDHLRIATKTWSLHVVKKPFGLAFYQADDKTLLTATSPGLGLDTDIKASLKRDACGREEHFVGLQLKNDAQTLDHRGQTVTLKDENGAGWVAPFFMSSAGYGVFFNNEFSVGNRIGFHEGILIENTEKQGQLDLFFFRGPEYRRMLDLYTDLTGKPPMPPKKLLGHNYLVKGSAFLSPVLDEEAYLEWVRRGYPIDSCITFTDQLLATDKELAAVSATAKRIHAANGNLTCYFDLYSPGTFSDSKPWPTQYPYSDWTAFKATVKARLLDRGVDGFWIDETEDIPYVTELYQALVEACEAQGDRRGYICGRGGQAGCQRYGYPWMGDTGYDKSSSLAKLCNGLIGVAHSTADMACADVSSMTEDQFLSGVKENLLNPITQCNTWIPGQTPCHKPWEWSPRAELIFKKYLDLHYQLIPYFYSMFWQAHSTGLPDFRPLFLDQPGRADLYARDEFMVGDWLLVAPLYQMASREVCLPPGPWYGYFDGVRYQGDQLLKDYCPSPEGYPLFIKAGAIIPMAEPMRYVDEKPGGPLVLDIYPAGDSSTAVYEDDGITRDYQKGLRCVTSVFCAETPSSFRISLAKREGAYQPARKRVLLKVLSSACPKEVTLEGRKLARVDTLDALMGRKQGWGFFTDTVSGAYKVFVAFGNTGEAAAVTVMRNPQAEKPPQPAGEAVFTALTDGSCDGRAGQGTDGLWSPSGTEKTPAYASLSVTGGTLATGKKRSDDPRAQAPSSLLGRKLRIELDIKDGSSRVVALHVLGGDRKGGSAKVDVLDPATGRVYDARVLPAIGQGVNLVYTLKGRVVVNLVSASGPDVALTGITFGWQPVLEFKGKWFEPAGGKPPALGAKGRWVLGEEKAFPAGTSVEVAGQPVTLAPNSDPAAGKNDRPLVAITNRIKQVEVRLAEPKVLTLCLRDLRTVKPENWFAGIVQGITVEAADLAGGGKLDVRFLPSSLGSVIYIQYKIRGAVKFTVTDADKMGSALFAVCLDPLP